MKNTLFVERFRQVFDKVYLIDTIDWQHHPMTIVKFLYYIVSLRKTKVVISCESGAASLIHFLYYFRFQRNVFYWVIGCGFANKIDSQELNPKYFHFLKRILVQSPTMVSTLEKKGLNNAMYIPNSKPIYNLEIKSNESSHVTFVFLSRILETKGVDLIIECSQVLNSLGLAASYGVDFYGSCEYYPTFPERINGVDNISYKGVLDLTNKTGYERLAQYDAMLFPTFYEGEGFPGVVLDAFISGVPVIASDWHINKEIITDGETGLIIPAKDKSALLSAMLQVINDRKRFYAMKKACLNEAREYDRGNVLSMTNLARIGLID